MNEKMLIKKCQHGERQAFDSLIRMYYDYVFGFLLKTAADETLCEDLTQETFLKMIKNIEKFHPEGAAFGTWLITIAKNCYIDHLRKNRIPFEDVSELPIQSGEDIENRVEQRLRYEELLAAAELLPPEQSVAIRLKYAEGLTLQEIADRFGVQPKTVKSRIHEGTVKLRKKLLPKERADSL